MLHYKSNTHLLRMHLKKCCTPTLFSALQYYIMAVTKMDSLCSLMLQDLKLFHHFQVFQQSVLPELCPCPNKGLSLQLLLIFLPTSDDENMKCLCMLNNHAKQPCLAECCSSIETVTMYRAQASEWEAISL